MKHMAMSSVTKREACNIASTNPVLEKSWKKNIWSVSETIRLFFSKK
jgi:hypothetical protein